MAGYFVNLLLEMEAVMPSRMIVLRERSARLVANSGKTHAKKIAEALHKRLEPHLQAGESMPDFRIVIALLARSLEHDMDELNAAEVAHKTESREDTEARNERDTAGDELYGKLINTRAGVDLVYGPAAAKALGLSGSTPRDPTTVLEFARRLRLSLAKLNALAPLRQAMTLNIATLESELDSAITRHQDALNTVARETRETEAELTRKSRIQASYDRHFSSVAACFEGLFRLAGQEELANRVRPSQRRPGRIHAEEELATDETPSTEPQAQTDPA